MAFLSKQSTGAILIMSILINAIIRKQMYSIKFRILGVFLPISIFFTWLLTSNNLCYFWDYTVIGVGDFTNSISYIDFMRMGIVNCVMALIVPIIIVVTLVFAVKRNDSFLLTLIITSLAGTVVIYPITDSYHFYIGALPVTFLLAILFKGKIKQKNPKQPWVCPIIAAAFFITYSITGFFSASEDIATSTLNHFHFIRINKELEAKVKTIDYFILNELTKGKDVFVLDGAAVIYMLPIDVYHKNYDMFLYGNLGSRTPEQYIVDLRTSGKAVLLIPKNKQNINWQFPSEIFDEIEQQFIRSGEIGEYYVYK